MDKLKQQVNDFSGKYSKYGVFVYENMRLVILLAFAAMSGFLVWRVNGLVNQEVEIPADQTVITSKKPDAEVLSTFNELSVQQVDLETRFDVNRQSPF